MFKPLRILQVGSMALLLASCANTQTGAISVAPGGASPGQSLTSQDAEKKKMNVTGGPGPSQPVPIRTGNSFSSSQGFLQPSGALDSDIAAYAQEVSDSRQVPLADVLAILATANYNETVARLMAPGKTRIRRSWVTYRNRFVEPVRIREGVDFWAEHRADLDQASRKYGVPASVIVAIIGVETLYGRDTGSFRVLDALATLGFRYPDDSRPERSQLFRDQLADLIELHHHKKLDALSVRGSYAGAMGLPQFMPGSLMRYAADGDGDGRIDLLGNPTDAVASVARFLSLHGWVPGLPVFAPVILPADAGKLVAGGLNPTLDWAELRAQGASMRVRAQALAAASDLAKPNWQHHKVGVIDLLDEPRNQAEYRTATPNFFAITHYNRSYFYAAAVADLAQELSDRMGYASPNHPD